MKKIVLALVIAIMSLILGICLSYWNFKSKKSAIHM